MSAAGLRFRFATPADVPALVELVTSAYRGEASRAGWTSEADLLDGVRITPEMLLEDIRRPGNQVLLAEADNDALLACAHLEHRESLGYFGMFAVRPEYQGSGIGRAVLGEAERLARETLGVSRLQMTVIDVRGELLAWYERRGYTRTGETRPFPYGDDRFGLPKRDDLRFAVLEKTIASSHSR